MPLKLIHADVLTTRADALLITIDGQARGLRGNIAHAFIRHWPEAYEDFDAHLSFPIPVGAVRRVDEDAEAPWSTILFVSTLHHLDTLSADEKLSVVRTALTNALSKAVSSGIGSLSTAVLKGGWRLPLEPAFIEMWDTYHSSEFHRQGRTLNICSVIEGEYDRLVAVKERFSFRSG